MRLEWISAGGGIDLSRKAHVARGVQSDVELRAARRKLHPGLRERFPVYRKILQRCIAAYVGPAHGSIALKIRLPDGSLNRIGQPKLMKHPKIDGVHPCREFQSVGRTV